MKTPLLKIAFPVRFAGLVDGLVPLIDPPIGRASSPTFAVDCDGERLHLPTRIYRPAISEANFARLSEPERLIAACWFTRHHDGFVRERFLRTLPAFDQAWIVAYVMAICGEYVVEILEYIWEQRSRFNPDVLGAFLRGNPGLLRKTRDRIISYWNCYHRSSCPNFSNYVGGRLLDFFDDCVKRPAGL